MKYRLARKIWNVIGTPDDCRYTQEQQAAAIRRIERTRDLKESNRFFAVLCEYLGPEGRAKIIKRRKPAEAFLLLMETPQEKWKGNKQAFAEAGF